MKTSISLLIISTLLLASCSREPLPEKKFYETVTVTTGSIAATDRAIAIVEGETTADLAFKTSGRIASVLVKPGDRVKRGDILATLGNEEGAIATLGLSSVLGDLSGISESIDSLYTSRLENLVNEEARATLGVELAEKDLAIAKKTLENSLGIFSGSVLSGEEKVREAEKNLEAARNNLTASKKLLETQGESLRRNVLSSMSNAFIIARNSRDFIDETLGVTTQNKTKNDGFETYLGAKNTASKTQAESSFLAFNTEYETMYEWYYANIVGKETISKETLHEWLTRSLSVLEDLRDSLHSLSNVLENSIASSNFSESDIALLKTRTSTLLSNLELATLDSFGNGVKGGISALDSFDSSSALKIQGLEDALKIAEEGLNLAKSGKDTTSSDVEKNLDILRASIAMKEDVLKLAKVAVQEVTKNRDTLSAEGSSKLREVDAKISETRMNRDLAENTIESGIIRAPFDGVILTRSFDVGATVSPALPVLTLTSTKGLLVKTSFNKSETPLSVWQNLALSRISDGVSFEAKVQHIRGEADTLHNKQYAEMLPTGTGLTIGDRVEVLFEKKSSWETHRDIIIPTDAIITKYGETGVYVLENGSARYQIVTVLASDEKHTSIKGLSVGQKVITRGKENVLDGEKLE